MCGIFGVMAATRCHQTHESFLVDAMQAGQVRGGHGSGMFTVTPDGYVRNQALSVSGTAFLMDKRAKDVLQSTRDARIVVGHNRFTTSGKNINEHCHPFRYEHLVGVHNGGVAEHVLKRIDPKGSHDVDSARIYAALNAADNPLDVLKQIDTGAYCLVWYDGRKRSLFMARNSARPMHLAETSTGIYFASEMGMLLWLLGRNTQTGYGKVPISRLDTMTLYEIPLDDPSQVSATPYEAPYRYASGGTYIPSVRSAVRRAVSGNTNMHPYYSGHGLFGGEAAPVAYKRYYSEHLMIRDFPVTTGYVDIIESLETNNTMYPEVPFMLLGIGKDVLGEDCAYGVLSSPDGERQYGNILAACRIRTDADESFFAGMLASGVENTTKAKEWSYPILPMQCRAMLLRPTGELVITGELPRDFDEKDVEECTWVFGIDQRTPTWVKEFVGPTCLINLKPEQLVSSWADLKAGKTQLSVDNDLPW